MITSAASSRRKHAVESFGSAQDCIGRVEKNMSLFAITRGQFSMLDAVNVGRSSLYSPWLLDTPDSNPQ